MCGIAGAFQQADGKIIAAKMMERLGHRGPDACGIREFVSPDCVAHLAHLRLSIIDLTAAADQPFSKGDLTMSYNGEVYNYREIRAELHSQGVEFRTESDTEVVLEAWRAWGPSGLLKLRGMFAFAVFDEQAKTMTLVRDRFGIKPMYVHPRGEGVVFASELKAIISTIGSELTVDPLGMVASTLYYWVPPGMDVVRGVSSLPAGTWTTFHRDGSTESGRFWDPASAASAAAGRTVDLAATIADSVDAHLVADVPVAVLLSGGLDSSLVAAIAAQDGPSMNAYTIRFRDVDQKMEAMPDDARYARIVARDLGLPLEEIELNPQVAELLPRLVDILDEPIGDPAAINTLLMCDAARESGAKVVLSGMGADELFGGYRKHLACRISHTYRRVPEALRHHVVAPTVARLPVAMSGRGIRTTRWAKRFLSFAELPEEAAFRRSYTLYDSADLLALLHPDLVPTVDEVFEAHRVVYDDNSLDDHVNRMCLADTRMFMQGLNLTYTDRASMAASVEVRVPFVDPEVFDAAFSVRGRAKIHGRTQKYTLKQAARQWLSDEIIDRPKSSFGAPIRSWVSNDLGEMIDDVLLNGDLVSSGFLVSSTIQQMIADHRSGQADHAKEIWQLLTLELWHRSMTSAGVGAA